jgi:prefoldin subunit 5
MDINVHVFHHYELDDINRKLDLLMAQIDDLQNEFDQLNTAVTELMANLPGAANDLQERINQLVADDEVENNKLVGLTQAMANLRSSVTSFSQAATPVVDAPPAEQPVEPTPIH